MEIQPKIEEVTAEDQLEFEDLFDDLSSDGNLQPDSDLEDSNTSKIRDNPPPSQERFHKTQEDDRLGDFQSDCSDSGDWGTFKIRDDLPPCQERSYTTLELFSRLIYIPISYKPLTQGSRSNSRFGNRFGSRISTR